MYRPAGFVAKPRKVIRVAIAIPLKITERPFDDDGQFVVKGRLKRGQPILAHPDQRCPDGRMRAAFLGQCGPGRGSDQDEPCILTSCVVQGIARASNKGIMHFAVGDQPFAKQRMRQVCSSKEQHQVHLGDARLNMLPLRRKFPSRR